MIRAKSKFNGVEVKIEGEAIDRLEEFTSIIKSVRNSLTSDVDEEFADEVIALCGQMAFAESEEDAKGITDHFAEYLDKKAEKLGIRLGGD